MPGTLVQLSVQRLGSATVWASDSRSKTTKLYQTQTLA